MIDLFLLLTPILLLGVVALLGFAGCGFHPREATSISIAPNSGTTLGGTPVTISLQGDTFLSNVTVKFAAVSVPATITGATTVTANTPAEGAGSVDVEVDYQGPYDASTASLPDGFTYVAPPVLVVTPLLPPAVSRVAAGVTNSASLPTAAGIKLVVVTVEWGGSTGAVLNTPTSAGVTFTQLGATDTLNPQKVQVATFYAFADLTSGITVTATLIGATSADFNLLVSAYDNVNSGSVPVSASTQGTGITISKTLDTSALTSGDLVYAVIITRGGGGALKGSLTPGQSFTAETAEGDYILLETDSLQQSDIGSVTVSATDAQAIATSLWYVLTVTMEHA
jgi:IPT/TIG domain